MSKFVERLRNEPALVTGFVGAVLILLTEFSVPVTDGQATAIIGVIVAAQAFVVRSKVVPSRNVRLRKASR